MAGGIASVILFLVALLASLAVVHADAVEPLLATCVLLGVIIGVAARLGPS